MAFINVKKYGDILKLCFLNFFIKKNNDSLINNKFLTHFVSYYTPYGQAVSQRLNDLGFGLLHYALVRIVKPKRILCIGSGRGFVPAILSIACRDNGLGIVDFVDAGFRQESKVGDWEGKGFWTEINPRKYFGFLDTSKHMNVYIKTTKEFIKGVGKRRYQYIYIDANHTYEGVRSDFNLVNKYLDKFGLLLFHDSSMDKKNRNYGVNKFIKKMNFRNKIELMFDAGLTIIQK